MIEEAIRIIIGSIFVLFLPGLVWSYVFFKKEEIDWIERIALSFGLSIAIVPLTIFWLNFFLGIKINLINTTLAIIAIIGIGLVLLYKQDYLSRKTREKLSRFNWK